LIILIDRSQPERAWSVARLDGYESSLSVADPDLISEQDRLRRRLGRYGASTATAPRPLRRLGEGSNP